jgi:ABC-type transporter Mla subunit MlaD
LSSTGSQLVDVGRASFTAVAAQYVLAHGVGNDQHDVVFCVLVLPGEFFFPAAARHNDGSNQATNQEEFDKNLLLNHGVDQRRKRQQLGFRPRMSLAARVEGSQGQPLTPKEPSISPTGF